MQPATYTRFIRFLHEELALPQDAIAIAQRYFERDSGSFPMILWQYGLISLEQLERIFDWLEESPLIVDS
ncbi:DUF2949 domain-containing protein [Spirulina sp. 06S082]|uniref:DUF2949 domain-containing protein n=1 Tax=Spirulina sp. 06S082 TaxID=3110248 RepID=UPI002B20F52B|nr:DUF2949 domain-containing protein [Spirulina sp. 06S082]MEA5468465.1 DUF2949 domain-containing protein [Spirulina sp. 06S082]